jgi:hypothetical protein
VGSKPQDAYVVEEERKPDQGERVGLSGREMPSRSSKHAGNGCDGTSCCDGSSRSSICGGHLRGGCGAFDALSA